MRTRPPVGRFAALQPALCVALAFGAIEYGAASPSVYVLVPTESHAIIEVGKAGPLSFLAGHRHEVQAPIRGTVTVDEAHLEASRFELEIPSAALQVSAQGEPPDDVPRIQQKMASADVLDVARYPAIEFRSTALAVRAERDGVVDLSVTGNLTLHGVSRSLTVPVHAELTPDGVAAHAVFSVRSSDYGIKPPSVAGVVAVRDVLDVRVTVVAVDRRHP